MNTDIYVRWFILVMLLIVDSLMATSFVLNNNIHAQFAIILLIVIIVITVKTWLQNKEIIQISASSLSDGKNKISNILFKFPLNLCMYPWFIGLIYGKSYGLPELKEKIFQNELIKNYRTVIKYQFQDTWTILLITSMIMFGIWFFGVDLFSSKRIHFVSSFLNALLAILGCSMMVAFFWLSASIVVFRFFIMRRK